MSSAIEAELAAGIECSPSEDARTIKEGPLFLKMKRSHDRLHVPDYPKQREIQTSYTRVNVWGPHSPRGLLTSDGP